MPSLGKKNCYLAVTTGEKKKKNPRTPSCVHLSFSVAQGKTLTTPALSHLQNPTVYPSDGHLSGKRRPCIRLLIYVFFFSSNVLSLSPTQSVNDFCLFFPICSSSNSTVLNSVLFACRLMISEFFLSVY